MISELFYFVPFAMNSLKKTLLLTSIWALLILFQVIYKSEFLKDNFWNIITTQSGKPTGDSVQNNKCMHLPVPLVPNVSHYHKR